MKPQSKKFFILTVLIMLSAFGAAFFLTGCDIIGKEAVTENITNNGGTVPGAKMAEFSGSVSDAAAAVSPALKTSLNYAVSRAVELDANKNYIDVIDCATGLSVGTGAFGPLGTFTASTDILKHAGKNVMIDIGNKNADGENGLSLYKCFLGRMPNLNELPDTALFDSVKITNVIVTYETTAKALFAAEKELYNNPANAVFSFTTSEVQADKNVSKQFFIDDIFDKKIEAESGGAANIEAIANAVKTIAVVASSNLSDGDKNNLIQQNIVNVTNTLNAYARIVADGITNTAVSNIITQNSIPTELKFETAGGVITIDSSSTNKPLTPEIIQNINPLKMVEAPVFNITDGEYKEAQTVSIKTPTEGATIVYTLDGSEPREGSGIKYDSPVKINKTALIKAAAYKTGLVTSATVYLKIVITSVPVEPVEPVEPVIASLSVQAIETQTAGKGFSFMVKALDQSGELAVNDKPVEIKLSAETPDVACYASDSFAEKTAIATISGGMAKIYARGTKAGKTKIALTANGIEAAAYFEIISGAAAELSVTKEPSEKPVAGFVLEQQPQVSLSTNSEISPAARRRKFQRTRDRSERPVQPKFFSGPRKLNS